MKHPLETYLNDHLAGSAVGLMLVSHLESTAPNEEEKRYFSSLKERIAEDKEILVEIIEKSGFEEATVRHAIGSAAARTGIWRMEMNGMGVGELGRFEMIELLEIGIHGKSRLWRTLRLICSNRPEWQKWDFDALEEKANHQSRTIETFRSREAFALFSPEV